jgi:hypothetical protein
MLSAGGSKRSYIFCTFLLEELVDAWDSKEANFVTRPPSKVPFFGGERGRSGPFNAAFSGLVHELALTLKILDFCKVCWGFPLLPNLVGMPNKGCSRGVSESPGVHLLHLCNILGNLRPLKLANHL